MIALMAFSLGAFFVYARQEEMTRFDEVRVSLSAQLHKQIAKGKQISLQDPSTLLLQPWYFELRTVEEMNRCERYSTTMALMRVVIRDEPVQAIGDWQSAFAEELGAKFYKAVRTTDLVARLSESEYVACLPQTTEKGVRAAARRVATWNPTLPLNIGWATFPEDGRNLTSLLEHALARSSQSIAETSDRAVATHTYAEVLELIRN
jgi:GGDEF domain-containing protein